MNGVKYSYFVSFIFCSISVHEWHEVTVKMTLSGLCFMGFVNKRDTVTAGTVLLFLIHILYVFLTHRTFETIDGATA